MNNLEHTINHDNNSYAYYNKRNDFSTVFDDKKILQRNFYKSNNIDLNNENRDKELNNNRDTISSDYSRKYNKTPIIMPTTSANYGSYFLNKNQINNY